MKDAGTFTGDIRQNSTMVEKFNNKQRMLMISSVGVVIIALVILGLVMSKPKMVELVASDDAKQASEIKVC